MHGWNPQPITLKVGTLTITQAHNMDITMNENIFWNKYSSYYKKNTKNLYNWLE